MCYEQMVKDHLRGVRDTHVSGEQVLLIELSGPGLKKKFTKCGCNLPVGEKWGHSLLRGVVEEWVPMALQ